MRGRRRAALQVWRSRAARTHADNAYALYIGVMIALVAVAPLARAAWMSATSPQALAGLGSATAPGATIIIVSGLWASALLWGRERGPALRPPFVTHALASSDLAGSETFRGPMLRGALAVTAPVTAIAGLIGLALLGSDRADPLGVAAFVVAGVFTGVITTVLWLVGQTFPHTATPGAVGLIGLGTLAALAPALQPFTPWGWVGLTFPGGGSSPAIPALGALGALAAGLCGLVPTLLNRLTYAELLDQATRWEAATMHATGMGFGDAVSVYRAPPRFGRRLRAVRPFRWQAFMFLRRDAIGSMRTPGRLLSAAVAMAAAGSLVAVAALTVAPPWGLGAAAGVLVFAGLGPVTDGLRHAVNVAGDLPIYGVGDGRLVAAHALFPLTFALAVLLTAAIAASVVAGSTAAPSTLAALVLGLLGFLTRLGSALKGPLPPALLAPMPTPMGDLGGAVRLAWAVDGVLLAGLAGAASALIVPLPALSLGMAVVLIGLCVHRWHRRK